MLRLGRRCYGCVTDAERPETLEITILLLVLLVLLMLLIIYYL